MLYRMERWVSVFSTSFDRKKSCFGWLEKMRQWPQSYDQFRWSFVCQEFFVLCHFWGLFITWNSCIKLKCIIYLYSIHILHRFCNIIFQLSKTFAKFLPGKSPKNIEKLLAEVVMRLKKRFPSVLLLDNLDFFPRSPDEDQRNINLEAVAECTFAF